MANVVGHHSAEGEGYVSRVVVLQAALRRDHLQPCHISAAAMWLWPSTSVCVLFEEMSICMRQRLRSTLPKLEAMVLADRPMAE